MLANFNIPSSVIVGGGASAELAAELARIGVRRAFAVTDRGIVSIGTAEKVLAPLEAAGIHVSTFADVQPDPTDKNVLDGLNAFRDSGANAIVAIGGGSPIDCAKVIGALSANPLPISPYMGYHKFPRPGVPLIAIPTTAGTGSEVTKVAVITDTANNVKMMMLDAHLLPRVAIVDYQLTMSMPAELTAAVGVDTLTHGIEAYVSRKASAMTDPIALSCIHLAAGNLRTACRRPDDAPAREAMMLAACQGGMAFANSSVCLVHGMSRPLGAVFHLPHGLSNAVLLPAVTRFSVWSAIPRYATIARTMNLASNIDSDERAAAMLGEGLEALNADLGVPRLRNCRGVERETFDRALEKMAADALASGSPQNNPKVPTAVEIVALYREAW